MRFDEIVDLNPRESLKKGDVYPFVDMASLPSDARDFPFSELKAFKRSGSKFRDGDTLIARITPCLENGKGGFVSGLGDGVRGFGSTEFIVARPKDPRDALFIYYLSRSDDFRQIAISRMEGTSGRQRVPWQQVASIDVPRLEPSERWSIAAILGTLDDKIENNRKTAATLEEMARALYRSWFVDFNPVHAKAAGEKPAFMDEETAALFPDRFGDDGLPEGWVAESLAEHVSASRGLSYKGSGLCKAGDGLPLHNLNSVYEGGGYKASGIKYYNGDFKTRHHIQPGDLIVTNTEQGFDLLLIGHAALVPYYFGPNGLFSQHIYKVEPKAGSPLSREWLYLTLSVSPKGQEIRSYSNGTTVNMLPVDALEIPEILVPSGKIVSKFDDAVMPMFARKQTVEAENETLATLRDTLLPKLMSGEIRVGEAREQVEELT